MVGVAQVLLACTDMTEAQIKKNWNFFQKTLILAFEAKLHFFPDYYPTVRDSDLHISLVRWPECEGH